jgi:GGDEF domain-containing protein
LGWQRLRQAVASISWTVMASVGVASVTLFGVGDEATRTMLEHLVDAADAAMHEAKRAGGNRTRQAGVSQARSARRPQ